MKKFAVFFGLAALCVCLLRSTSDKEKLDAIAKQIHGINNKLEELKKEEGSILNDIYKIELQYEKAHIENNKIKLQLTTLGRKINKKNSEKKKLEMEIQESKKNLKQILRLLYKIGGNTYLKLFIRINTLEQLFTNYRLFISLIDYKSNEINKLKTNIQRLMAVKKELEIHHTNLQNLQRQKEQKLRDIRYLKQSKLNLIRKINNDKKQYKQLLDELEAEAAQLNKLIYGKPLKRLLGSIDLERVKGKLKWPIKGKIISFFGKKKSTKFNTYIINNGIKIKPIGSDEVRAIYSGEVVFADYYKGYGNLVIIQHAKNLYTLYGHCEKMIKQRGDNVNEGELISLVGDTGYTSGKALYFEIRTQLKPQDPLKWLSKRQ
ncbi:MAG: peptidoglycan DD-metalloendopeptidase family protein [Candidatus Aminicenantes bacterium]|nr:MAG: peptidoglycan DD-metalloendopeptidase family protein [Candidatus Aminicenantes bacterium]